MSSFTSPFLLPSRDELRLWVVRKDRLRVSQLLDLGCERVKVLRYGVMRSVGSVGGGKGDGGVCCWKQLNFLTKLVLGSKLASFRSKAICNGVPLYINF